MMTKRLRIGVFIDSYWIPNWAYKMLELVIGGDYAEIALIVVQNNENSLQTKKLSCGAKTSLTGLICSGLLRFDRNLFKVAPDAFEPKEIRHLLPQAHYFNVTPTRFRTVDDFTEEDCMHIRAHEVDVFIKLGFQNLGEKVLSCAKYGVWSVQHGDRQWAWGFPAGLWEVLEGRGETGSFLQILARNPANGKVLCRSYSQTDPLSIGKTGNSVYWKSLSFVPRKLMKLYEEGAEAFFSNTSADNSPPISDSNIKHCGLSITYALIWLTARHFLRVMYKKIWAYFYFDQWILLYAFSQQAGYSSDFEKYIQLTPPNDRFWADPFVVYKDKRYYVFFEEFLWKRNKGHISCFSFDVSGKQTEPLKILERPYHLSYPFVFSYQNEYYMIPETGENRTIELYRSTKFPSQWEQVAILMHNVDASDATILQKNEKWWLFVNLCETSGASSYDELFIFYAEDLFSGHWTAHKNNPVVSDVKSSRPAGKIFEHNGSIYRPSQNSFKIYGYGLKINKIIKLSETEYEEMCVTDIGPHWDTRIHAVHTLNFDHELTVIDGLITRAIYPSALFRFGRKLWTKIQNKQ